MFMCIEHFDLFKMCNTKKQSFLLEENEYNKLLTDDECGICLEMLKCSPCIKTERCNHIFHKYCYKKYLQQTKIKKELGCPFCNSKQEKLNMYVCETI